MRLFTAIELDQPVQAELDVLISELRRRVVRDAPAARLTWASPDGAHLTLRFIGEVDQERAGRIISALREPFDIEPFTVRWSGLGAFPTHGPPRVLWAGAGDGRDALAQLEAAISSRLLRLGVAGGDRQYRPHLTLARVRHAAGLRAARLFEGLSAQLGETRVEAITLFESRLSPKGPTYTVLERTTLRDG